MYIVDSVPCVLEVLLATYVIVVQHDTNLELKIITRYHPMLELKSRTILKFLRFKHVFIPIQIFSIL